MRNIFTTDSMLQIRILAGHNDAVTAADVLSGGRFAISSSLDGTIVKWDLESASDVWRLSPKAGPVNHMVVTADGFHILSGHGDGTMRLWNVETKREIRQFNSHSGPISAISSTWTDEMGGAILALSTGHEDKAVKLWDVMTGELVREVATASAPIRCVLLPKGKTLKQQWVCLSIESNGKVTLWDMESTDTEIFSVAADANCVDSEPDFGRAFLKFVLGNSSGDIAKWGTATDFNTEQEFARHHVMDCAVTAIHQIRSQNLIITGGLDGAISVWEDSIGTFGKRLALNAHQGAVSSVKFFEETTNWLPSGGYVLSAGDDNTVRLWRLPFTLS